MHVRSNVVRAAVEPIDEVMIPLLVELLVKVRTSPDTPTKVRILLIRNRLVLSAMEKDDGARLRQKFRLSGGGNHRPGKGHHALEIEAAPCH